MTDQLKIIGSICTPKTCISSNSNGVASVSICGERVLLAHHPCPDFLLGNCATTFASSTEDQCSATMIVLAQPFSEAAKQRSLSVNTERCGVAAIPSTQHRSSSSDLDVTGSPLRMPFSERLRDGELMSPFVISVPEKQQKTGPRVTTFRGKAFDANTARCIWSELNKLVRKLPVKDTLLPIYILVNGEDSKGTVLYGLGSPSIPVSAVSTPGGTNTPGNSCCRSHVYNSGPVNLHALPQLDTLRSCCTGPAVAAYVESHAMALYDVITENQEQQVQQEQQEGKDVVKNTPRPGDSNSSPSVISLSCRWPRPTGILSNPAPDAATTLSIRVPAGDSRGLLSRELRLLSRAVVGLRTREVEWYVRAPGQQDITDSLNKLFHQNQIGRAGDRLKDGVGGGGGSGEARGAESRGACNFDEVITGKLTSRNTDFLDGLWLVLCECESLHEVRAGLLHVFHAVATNHIRPQIHVRNTTQVATICRGLMRGQASEPELTGLMPLQMLVELGLCKVRKNFTTILLAGELATDEQLSPFVCHTPNNAPQTAGGVDPMFATPELSTLHLYALQLALHVASCLRSTLKLPPTTLAGYTVQVLQQLQQDRSDVVQKSHTFVFPLQTSAIKDLLDSVSPSTWQVTLTSSDSNNNTATSAAPHGKLKNTRMSNSAGSRGGHAKSSNKSDNNSSAGSGYVSTLQATVTRVPLIRLLQLDDEFADLSLLEADTGEKTNKNYFCNYVATVTDSMLQ